MATLRGIFILILFFVLTVPLLPVQALFLRVAPAWARQLPNIYHRVVCKLFGLRLNVTGKIEPTRPVLLVSNHTSWLDIPVLSAVAPVSFVAKKEVASWPFVASLARLQRSVFIDRERRTDVSRATTLMLDRLSAGDSIVLFPEGTSSDGNRVLSFRTSLFAAAKPPEKFARPTDAEVVVQTVSMVYRHLHGVPLGRAERTIVSWYGDMDMPSHAWQLLKAGPLDVDIVVGEPHALGSFKDRKDLARQTEDEIRGNVLCQLRGLPHDTDLQFVQPDAQAADQAPLAARVRTASANSDERARSKRWR